MDVCGGGSGVIAGEKVWRGDLFKREEKSVGKGSLRNPQENN